MKRALLSAILFALFAVNFLSAQVLIGPQATDGAGWSFVLVITNTTASSAAVSISFFKDSDTSGDTDAWTPPFVEGNVNLAAMTVPAGSSVFLHSTGTAPTLTQGWFQIAGPPGIQAYVVYTYVTGQSSQSATAPAVPASSGVLAPFENVDSSGAELAIVNPNGAEETVLVNVNVGGSISQTTFTIPAGGHVAVVTNSTTDSRFSATAGQRGLLELYVSSGSLGVIALRSHTNTNGSFSFTTAPAYSETIQTLKPTGTGGGGGGGGGVPKGDVTFAGFSIGQTTSISSAGTKVTDTAGGVFAAYTPTAFNAPYASTTKIGSCTVYSANYPLNGTYPASPSLYLNAGNTLSLSGPSLPAADQTIPITNTPAGPVYVLSSIPSGTFQKGGTYTLTGTGGTQVEAFKVSTTLPDNFTTNLASITTINRSQPLVVTWTGTGFQGVIVNVSSLVLSTTTIDQVNITCLVPASDGTFSVPSQALSMLSATTPPLGIGTLSLSTAASSSDSISAVSAKVTSFTPNLVGDGKMNYGAFAGFDSVNTSVTIQ